MSDTTYRCNWCVSDPLYIHYHDFEWGVPLHNDQKLFEMLVLEGFQAGLSWLTILKKRDAFQKAFDKFDAKKVASYDTSQIDRLMKNSGIIRNRAKISAAVVNARSFLDVKAHYGSFDSYIWQFVDGKPIVNHWNSESMVPGKTRQSELMSRELRQRGFKFVGPTICYAFMQATGLVNDHITACHRHAQLQAIA